MPAPTDIGDQLRQLRQDARLTQADLAAKLGCSKKKIANVETGVRRPSFELLGHWADACGRHFAYAFLDGRHEPVESLEIPTPARRAIALIRTGAHGAPAAALEALQAHVVAWRQTLDVRGEPDESGG